MRTVRRLPHQLGWVRPCLQLSRILEADRAAGHWIKSQARAFGKGHCRSIRQETPARTPAFRMEPFSGQPYEAPDGRSDRVHRALDEAEGPVARGRWGRRRRRSPLGRRDGDRRLGGRLGRLATGFVGFFCFTTFARGAGFGVSIVAAAGGSEPARWAQLRRRQRRGFRRDGFRRNGRRRRCRRRGRRRVAVIGTGAVMGVGAVAAVGSGASCAQRRRRWEQEWSRPAAQPPDSAASSRRLPTALAPIGGPRQTRVRRPPLPAQARPAPGRFPQAQASCLPLHRSARRCRERVQRLPERPRLPWPAQDPRSARPRSTDPRPRSRPPVRRYDGRRREEQGPTAAFAFLLRLVVDSSSVAWTALQASSARGA